MFKMDGIWYALVKEGSNYVRVQYAFKEDNNLRVVYISTDGRGEYSEGGIKF